jgi:hypothetical protein
MITVLSPPNVRTRSEPAVIFAPPSERATCAAPMVTGRVPYSLDSTTRTREPPMETRATWRIVWFQSVRGNLMPGKKSVSQTG